VKPSIFLVAACLLVAGCTTSAVEMRNPLTGQVAKCGPYGFGLAFGGLHTAERERGCIADYQRQGFERAL
jgi:hypothetical protein